jgi:gliding motility-associated-like protein
MPVPVNIIPVLSPPTTSDITICSGSVANLHASASTVINWYNVPTGGVPLISSPDYTTPSLTSTTTYYVSTSSFGCESARVPVTVTVDPIPSAPIVQTDTVCYGSNATLTASGSGPATYQWFNALAGGKLLATGATYTTPALTNSTTYYVQASNGPCGSLRIPVNVIVKPLLSPPSVSGVITCSGSVTTLTATSQGGTYQWFDAPLGGNLLATTATYTTPVLTATTNYYVQNTISGCVSPRALVTVTITPPPITPVVSNTSVCSGSPAVLTASGAGTDFSWYDSPTGGNLLSTSQTFVTPSLTSQTTYYVQAGSGTCASLRAAVTVSINPAPLAPTANGTTICPGTTATLTASGPGVIQWYDAPAGGSLLTSGNTFTTPALNSTTTYYIQSTNGVCTSLRTPVTVTITAVSDPQFQYPSGTFCTSSPNAVPVINNPAGGVFSAVPAGLVFVDNKTGEINIGASTPGDYSISFLGNGTCPSISKASLSIVVAGNPQFSFTGPYCQDSPNPLPVFPKNSSGGVFTAAPSGLVFVSSSTGEINLSVSQPGTYTITNTIPATGTCPSSQASTTVVIYPKVLITAGLNQHVKPGVSVQLQGGISGAVTTGKWSGGAGAFSDPTSPTTIYTPAPGEKSASLTLTSDVPPGPCGAKSSTVLIVIDTTFSAPVVPGTSVCFGSSAVLAASASSGVYQWYDAPAGGKLLATGQVYTTPALTANTTYYVQASNNGFTSSRTAVLVTVNNVPIAPSVQVTPICSGNTALITATGSTGTYQWYDSAIGGNLLAIGNTYNTPVLTANTTYFVEATFNGCTSGRTEVDVPVSPVPNINSAPTGNICSGNALTYTITASLPNATFVWNRVQVAGITNPAAVNQTSSVINETLINNGSTAVNVTYVITPYNGTCPGPAFNYVVTVYPTPIVTSPANATICNYTAVNYAVSFNTPSTFFTWSRAAVPGITNAAVSGQTASIIKEVLFNNTTKPVDVTYTIMSATSTCTGIPFTLVITVNPTAAVTSAALGSSCNGVPQNYTITSNIPSAIFLWSRSIVAGISNTPVNNQPGNTITEALVNTSNTPVKVVYTIVPLAYGCNGSVFHYSVIVNPSVAAPVPVSNSPVCVGSIIHLTTATIPNASYLWTGPNGFTSTQQNPNISNANDASAGTYNLSLIVNGCSGPAGSVTVSIDHPSVANAGPDQYVCVLVPSVQLAGNVSGGGTTGTWSSAGTGTFSPSASALNASYVPSDADRAAGSVVLTLATTNNANCAISTSNMTIKFGPSPGVVAGPDQTVCAQTTGVKLAGKILIGGGALWTTSGSGTFSPSADQTDATYIPGADDVQKGSVVLTLRATAADACYIATNSLTVNLIPPATVFAGGTRDVLQGHTITLTPTVSESNVKYLWFPNIGLSSDTVKNPVLTGGSADRVYTLTVTDSRGCISSDQTLIKVQPEIIVPNTFTPNGDGINDVWNISGLIAYTQTTVDIFTRYGQKVYHSNGYDKPWDGTLNNQALPVGVYYYIIDTKVSGQVLSGYVTIIR